jgi:hypothetical protein
MPYARTERAAEYGAQMKSTDLRRSASQTAWWKPERLTWLLWAKVACNAVIPWLAKDGPRAGFNSDVAGNGLARAFQELFVMGGAGLVGIVALLFIDIRNRGISYFASWPLSACLRPRCRDEDGMIIWRATIVLAAIALIFPGGYGVSAPTAASPVDAGTTLAKLTYPAEMDAVAMTYAFTTDVTATYRADANFHALDVKHPGLVDAMVAALLLEYRRARDTALPRLWARTGAAYAGRLNAVELRQAVAFFDSPAGHRIVELAIQGIAAAPLPENGADNTVIYPAEPTREDAMAQATFDATSAGRKLAAMRTEVAAINDDWNTKAAPTKLPRALPCRRSSPGLGCPPATSLRPLGTRNHLAVMMQSGTQLPELEPFTFLRRVNVIV